jgi:dienelactone hydrolase
MLKHQRLSRRFCLTSIAIWLGATLVKLPGAEPEEPAVSRHVTAVVNARFFVRTDKPPIDNGVVILRGRHIVAAATRRNVEVPNTATVLDGSGLAILPSGKTTDTRLLAAGQLADLLFFDDFPTSDTNAENARHRLEKGQWVGPPPPEVPRTQTPRTEVPETRWRNLPHTNTSFVPHDYAGRIAWEKKRDLLRRQIAWSAGFAADNDRTAPQATISQRRKRDGYTVENVYFQSRPGLYVAGNLYRPLGATRGGHPGILSPHGHWGQGRLHDDAQGSIQARCITLARLGCVAFAWDMLAYNDSARQLDGKYHEDSYWSPHNRPWSHGKNRAALWNVNSLGVQLLNSLRALDFLASLPEVDSNRLACTGCSGGGTQTFLLAALDQRIRVAAPVCMISAYMQGGCSCENAPGLRLETQNVELGALMAPRPLLMISATTDWTARTPVVEFPAIRGIYALYDAVDHVKEAQFEAAHGYNLAMRETVYPWLGRWLGFPCAPQYREPPYTAEPPKTLLSFVDEVPANALGSHEELIDSLIEETRQATERLAPHTDALLHRNRDILLEGLTLSVGANALEVENLQLLLTPEPRRSLGVATLSDGVLVETRRGLRIPITRIVASANATVPTGCTLIVDDTGKEGIASDPHRLSQYLRDGSTVYAIDPFGFGSATGPDGETSRSASGYFATFNRTDDAERVYDILAAIQFCAQRGVAGKPPTQLTIVGRGRTGPLTALAGAIARKRLPAAALSFVIDADRFPEGSEDAYLERLFVPGVLRAGGLRNALALLAPAPLRLHNTGGTVDTTWAKSAYRVTRPDAQRLTIQAGPSADG